MTLTRVKELIQKKEISIYLNPTIITDNYDSNQNPLWFVVKRMPKMNEQIIRGIFLC
jgi:hypothetical protein